MTIPDFIIPLCVALITQLMKLIIDVSIEGKMHIADMRRSGGFPSVHSGISTSITTLFYLKYGINSPEFTLAFIFSLLFWYDAMHIRYEAGKHAKQLNQINTKLKHILEISEKHLNLKERLGHTFIEVLGGIVIGFLLTIILYYRLIIH